MLRSQLGSPGPRPTSKSVWSTCRTDAVTHVTPNGWSQFNFFLGPYRFPRSHATISAIERQVTAC